ncbi:uncharacterized protein DSM5745_03982 [Aspergillus mulundensis]|uniref:Uncharacterized protein n=1 Tax=Aspergillus mulundensis TaxID=1810919 RepID=A0A3D8SBG4_9EURO|nr:hypothetical protein DSM5745_03982 [Aspergillus mulundensis]RDW83656.1 hypothetical protein DSM5745_03982 [Aspergillus mulundensis]
MSQLQEVELNLTYNELWFVTNSRPLRCRQSNAAKAASNLCPIAEEHVDILQILPSSDTTSPVNTRSAANIL